MVVVGSGGREHALAAAMARTAEVMVTPGNPGMSAAGVACHPGPPELLDADLYVVGPEAPLVAGLADRLRAAGRMVLGPGAAGARLEGSKAWMKDFLAAAGVPTARHRSFTEPGPAIEWLRSLPAPWVVKTDGLAGGKGVLVTDDRGEAEADVRAKLDGSRFGGAGRTVVVEEGLVGVELSLMALCDGERAVPLAPARDHKRLGDGDSGPNTGGMGAFSPVPGVDADLVEEIMSTAVRPTLAALAARGIDYRGVLYAGLMLTSEGPRVIEYNVRFGDPEAQVVLPRWEGDVAAALAAAAAGCLDDVEAPRFSADAAVCVVLAADGYPELPRSGDALAALDPRLDGVSVFAAGVGGSAAAPVTAGGRVLGVTGVAPSLAAARDLAYRGVDRLAWPGCRCRTDIAGVANVAAGHDHEDAGSSRPLRAADR